MMKSVKNIRYVFAAVVVFTTTFAAIAQAPPRGSIVQFKVPSPSLAGNLLGDPVTQPVFVYLPPSYNSSPTKRFPALYLLHGYTGRPEEWVKDDAQGMDLQSQLDSMIAKGTAAEMIVVVPNGRNAYLGSFYTNSQVTGAWEDYIFRDVVSYIDNNYRTLARPSSRGIAGHSMGGYGAFMQAMKHPDVFGAVYSLSPCCLGFEGDLSVDKAAWEKAAKVSTRDVFAKSPASFDDFWTIVLIALSAAFAPDRERSPIYAEFPFVVKNGALTRNERAYASFRSKMPLYLVEEYRENLMKLRGISLDVGEFDEFTHIRLGTAKLSRELSEREIPHSFEIYKGGDHGNKITERFSTKLIPFFSTVLEK